MCFWITLAITQQFSYERHFFTICDEQQQSASGSGSVSGTWVVLQFCFLDLKFDKCATAILILPHFETYLANYVAYLVQTALEGQFLEYSSGLNSETQETEVPAEYIECDWWVVTNDSHAEGEEPVLKGELKELWKLPSEEQKHPQLSMRTKKSFRNLWLYELQELLPGKGVEGLGRAHEGIPRIVLLSIPPPTPVIGLDQLWFSLEENSLRIEVR